MLYTLEPARRQESLRNETPRIRRRILEFKSPLAQVRSMQGKTAGELTVCDDAYRPRCCKVVELELEDVERFEQELPAKEELGSDELARVRASFRLPTFEHVRERAIFEIHMATAFRFDTVRSLPLAALDRVSGRVEVITKGGKEMKGRLDPNAMAHVRAYLRLRPETNSPQLFVTEEGNGLCYWGGRMIWRRIQRRSGVKRLGSHLVRHTFAQTMARKGAPIADIQDVLGHTSDKMARHYAGEARKAAAAELMAKHSLAS